MKTAIEYYDSFAPEYDELASQYHWISPKIMYGMLYDKFEPNQKLLDVGIGTGLSSIPFYKNKMEIYGIDGSQKMINFCIEKKISKSLEMCDIEKDIFPFADNFFDLTISNGVCYFISNLEHYFSECLRVTKSEGYFTFNYEEFNDGLREEYLNYSNCTISKKLKDKTGVTVFKYSPSHIISEINKHNVSIEEIVRYFAYKSPTTQEDIYFTLLILKKNK